MMTIIIICVIYLRLLAFRLLNTLLIIKALISPQQHGNQKAHKSSTDSDITAVEQRLGNKNLQNLQPVSGENWYLSEILPFTKY